MDVDGDMVIEAVAIQGIVRNFPSNILVGDEAERHFETDGNHAVFVDDLVNYLNEKAHIDVCIQKVYYVDGDMVDAYVDLDYDVRSYIVVNSYEDVINNVVVNMVRPNDATCIHANYDKGH